MKATILKFALIIFCVTPVLYTSCGYKTVGETIDDTAIAASIESKLLADPSNDATDIDIDVYKGQVQLSGFVSSELERQRAEDIAETVEGVVSVNNDLIIRND